MRSECNSLEGSNSKFKTCSIVESGSDCSDEAGGSDMVSKTRRDNKSSRCRSKKLFKFQGWGSRKSLKRQPFGEILVGNCTP